MTRKMTKLEVLDLGLLTFKETKSCGWSLIGRIRFSINYMLHAYRDDYHIWTKN